MSLLLTNLENFRAENQDIDKWEYRDGANGAWMTFLNESRRAGGVVNDDMVQKAIRSVGSTMEIPVLDFEATTIQNVTQPLVVVGDPSTSNVLGVTFVDYYWGFLIHPAQHFNNEISMQREFNRQMRRYVVTFLDELDQAAITALEASKSQVMDDLLGARYTFPGNVVQGPLAEADAVIGDINVLGRGIDYPGPWVVIGNPSLESHVRNRLLEQGEQNDRDKRYQYNDKTFRFSTNLANAADQRFTGFAVQEGTVGMLEQYLPDNVMRNRSTTHQWDINPIPGLGMSMGTYFYDGASNGTALSGAATAHLTATLQRAYGFHKRIALVVNYNSDRATIPAPQYKFQIATT